MYKQIILKNFTTSCRAAFSAERSHDYFINSKSYIYVSIQVDFKYSAFILVDFLSYIQRSYLRGLKELIGPAGFAFGLSGGCSYGFSSRAQESASGSFAIKRLNASEDECPAPPSSFHLSFGPIPFFPRRARFLLILFLRLFLTPVKTRQLSCPITAALKHATADQ